VLDFFSVLNQEIGWEKVSEMTYFMSITQSINRLETQRCAKDASRRFPRKVPRLNESEPAHRKSYYSYKVYRYTTS